MVLRSVVVALVVSGGATPIAAQFPTRSDPLLDARWHDSPPASRMRLVGRVAVTPAWPDAVQATLWVGIGGLAAASILTADPAPLACGPCARSGVPGLDRWAITGRREVWDIASTVTLGGVAAVAGVDLLRQDGDIWPEATAALESATLALATSNVLKNIAARNRPYTFAEDLAAIDPDKRVDARQSFPSGHTAIAFALAASHWLTRGPALDPNFKRALGAATLLTGLLRVPAGRHFPSDVLAGAAVGIGSALLVYEIRF